MNDESKRHFRSRIIDTLNAQISSSRSNADRNVLFARKAFVLARHSLIAESRTLISQLRAVNEKYDARLSAWIMFAEGVIEHAESYNIPKSRDRIIRAHLVGQAANDPTLAGTAAAWLAYFDYLQGRYIESADFLDKAFSWSRIVDSEARSRACMILASGFNFAGDLVRYKEWIQAARSHAVESGDIAMQNSILFNASALHVSSLTLIDCSATVNPAELNFAAMSAQSASNLNNALGISNQPSMIPIQRAEILTIQKRWREACAIFDEHIKLLEAQGQARWAAKFIAHRAWCKANLSDIPGCKSDVELAVNSIDPSLDPDDLCVIHYRIAGSLGLCGDTEAAESHREIARLKLKLHSLQQSEVKKLFSAVADRHK